MGDEHGLACIAVPAGSDIPWEPLRQIVKSWAGVSAEPESLVGLEGGSIHTVVLVTCRGGHRAVLKMSPHRVDLTYAAQRADLELLREVGLPVPRVWACETATLDSPHSYLLMEYMPGTSLADARTKFSPEQSESVQTHLADLVAQLHARTGDHFRPSAADTKKTFADWSTCFADAQSPMLADFHRAAPLPPKSMKLVRRVHDRLADLLAHADKPRLIHGDLWAGNILTDGSRVTAILDPRCRYAHAEQELAYLELFKTTTATFRKRYAKTFRLDERYHACRRAIYQLYALIGQWCLFGKRHTPAVLAHLEGMRAIV